MSRPTIVRPPHADHEVRILGARPTPLRDFYHQVRFDHRHADIISDAPDGAMVIDLRRFHDVVPVRDVTAAGG